MLNLESITTIDEAVIYLSMTDNSKNKIMNTYEIDIALKIHGKGGFRDIYFNYIKMIHSVLEDAYSLALPLILFSKESESKLKALDEIKSNIKKIKTKSEKNIPKANLHPKAVFVCFYLLINYVFPELKIKHTKRE